MLPRNAHEGRALSPGRRTFRRRRRARLRYRSQRSDKPAGLAPSLRHHPDTVLSSVGRLCRLLMRAKRVAGFQTGDMLRAVIRSGTKAERFGGRVAIRASRKFNTQTADGVVQGIYAKHYELLARGDGYGYALTRELLSSPGLKQGYRGT